VSLILCTRACDYVTLLCTRVFCCATMTSSDSTDKCNIVMKFWYQIYASEHNEEGTFVLFESVHFLFLKYF
jgi:hypothetical protein